MCLNSEGGREHAQSYSMNLQYQKTGDGELAKVGVELAFGVEPVGKILALFAGPCLDGERPLRGADGNELLHIARL